MHSPSIMPLALIVTMFFVTAVSAAADVQRTTDEEQREAPRQRASQASAEYTVDTRGFNTFNVEASASLPHKLSLWGFVDFDSAMRDSDQRTDASRFFYEIDLRRQIGHGVSLLAEVNDRQGANNLLGRLGFGYVVPSNLLRKHDLQLSFKVLPYETDGNGWQASAAWSKAFPRWIGGRFSIGGFLDANFGATANQDPTLVTETQLRYRLANGLHLMCELRLNQFLDRRDQYGTGFGVRYHF